MAGTCNNQGEQPLINNHNQTVLQKHAAFFDRNKDGVIYPWETFQGCRAIGVGIAGSTFIAIAINIAFSGKTRPGKCPNLLFPIEVKNVIRSRHTSDSGIYDAQGEFDPAKFDELFHKHSKANANAALTGDELSGMLKANRLPRDYYGWALGHLEWKVLYSVCKDKNGLLQKETVRAFYTGDLFYQLEQERAREIITIV
ncbi:hypothetical protein MKW94_028209 [Papaver nudicaule]|uniref:Caleosin n=1 Tax=Papaver nudicaule TaxID=74823 RepID=A0AA41RVD3_PAPNU|nr:hypothetical protein [Papaver nudicaule]